jgi:hypothetical protein
MNTTTRAAFATVAEADVFAAHKAAPAVKAFYKADDVHAAEMARGWAVLANCGHAKAEAKFEECLHRAMGYRPEHLADELTF